MLEYLASMAPVSLEDVLDLGQHMVSNLNLVVLGYLTRFFSLVNPF